ncbi:phage protein NinX family protein [Providencia sp. PROV089]|uniref:phage protein NinX family protein n=1 Tax=Providencia sp. PROV089 TaxID=2949805 RepID=UPI00234BD94E|nr:phage protein NinX family protein [Providencia sp. PROV089]
MNKYTELSDFEINKKVASHVLNGYYIASEEKQEVYLATMDGGDFLPIAYFDPCNSPANAMTIIKDNLISITHDGIAWDVSCAKCPELSVWNGLENYNDNFYRKAMELFLLIKDAENEKV